MENNIVYFNDQLRDELEIIEKNSKNKNLIESIKKDPKIDNYISLIFGDAYVLLGYKNKNSIITPEEKKVFDIIELSLNNKESMGLIVQNQPDIFNIILKESSDFRKMNIFAKAKAFYSLTKVEKGLLTIIGYLSSNDIKKYDLNEKDIIEYISSFDKKSTNLEYELKNYMDFLINNNQVKYKELKNYMMLYMSDLNKEEYKDILFECKTSGITINFITSYINAVQTNKKDIHQIIKG